MHFFYESKVIKIKIDTKKSVPHNCGFRVVYVWVVLLFAGYLVEYKTTIILISVFTAITNQQSKNIL